MVVGVVICDMSSYEDSILFSLYRSKLWWITSQVKLFIFSSGADFEVTGLKY